MTVIVKKVGGSLAVLIPKAMAREAGLIEGTALDVSATETGVLLTRQGRRPRRPLDQIVARIDPASYRRRSHEFSADRPVGKELG